MKQILLTSLAAAFFAAMPSPAMAQSQEKEPDPIEMASQQADRLGELLDLDDWQIFYVDSTLQHDYAAMMMDLKDLQATRVANTDLYTHVQYKWMDQIEGTFKNIFTEEQWAVYLKNGAAKQQRTREKFRQRMEKAAQQPESQKNE